ncbi:CBS domain-containing protein [Streptomyces sp. NPDC001515]
MTPVQNQPRPADAGPVPPAPSGAGAGAGALDAAAPRVCDDMTVEVALSVMASARTGHLRICDHDSVCTALVTRAQLTVVREGPAYTDRLQLRDVLGGGRPHTAPGVRSAEPSTRPGRAGRFFVDGRGRTASALAPAL